jgi:hypothetical protein
VKQLTSEEAIAFGEGGEWKAWTPLQRAAFQMTQEMLCMPFDEFHKAITEALGRPVYTHEFGLNREGLIRELAGQANAPSLDEILALIPAHKLIVIGGK